MWTACIEKTSESYQMSKLELNENKEKEDYQDHKILHERLMNLE